MQQFELIPKLGKLPINCPGEASNYPCPHFLLLVFFLLARISYQPYPKQDYILGRLGFSCLYVLISYHRNYILFLIKKEYLNKDINEHG